MQAVPYSGKEFSNIEVSTKMILDIYTTMLVIGVVFFILSIYLEKWFLNIFCIIWFLILVVSSLNIEIPYVIQPVMNETTFINGSIYIHNTQEWGLNALLLVFVFINIPLAIYNFTSSKQEGSINKLLHR